MENCSRHTSGANHTTTVLTKAHFSSLDASKWSPRALRDASGGLSGSTWAILGHSWRALGAPLDALQSSWGAFGTLLKRSWGDRERSWELLYDFGLSLDRFWKLQHSIFNIRSSILGSRKSNFRVSARCAFDNAIDVEVRMICFRFSLELRM